MNNHWNNIVELGLKNQAEVNSVLEKLMTVARPDTVYSQPVTAGDHTVIMACEVSVGAGLGYGLGGGTDSQPASENPSGGAGGGGAGGGGAMGRPVAVINIGPDGVQITPVVDVVKLGLAFITVLGGILLALSKMRRVGR